MTIMKLDQAFFRRMTARPVPVLAVALITIVLGAAGLPGLVKDTSVTAFIPTGHPSLVADQKVEDVFELSDPVAVALISTNGQPVFTPDTLAAIAELTERISDLPNVRSERVTSLASESSIEGDDGSVIVEVYIDPYELDAETALSSFERWQRMPPHQGTLVSEDATGAIIMAELEDVDRADETYAIVRNIVAEYDIDGIELHVAGSGAVSGYLSDYIDRDARKLQPLVFVLVLGFIYLAFRRLTALPGPLLVVAGSTAVSLGLMAWSGIPYFAITNALPVIVVAISVADAIHILSAYYQFREQDPDAGVRTLVVRAMAAMARPITLTTLTTIAGFGGIAAVSIMPPITWFAVYAAAGVALAWVFSILVLPNMLLVVKPGRSPAFVNWRDNRPSGFGRFLARVGTYSPLRYGGVLVTFLAVILIAGFGASKLEIDRSQVDNFAADEPIRIADQLINERFAGTAFLDVIVESAEPDGLLTVQNMSKIREAQGFFESLPHVNKTVSIVDYLSQLHHAIENTPDAARGTRHLPDSDDAIGQYLFLYEITGDPADFGEEIDRDYRTALIRGVLDAHYFSENRATVEALERYVADHFDEPGLSATLAGDVNISYHWMQNLKAAHFKGVALSLALVLATSILVFRSPAAGIISVVPVLFAVLVLYACMGYLGIYLEPATSMFAAIALGVGVDFAVHLVDRLRTATDTFDGDLAKAIDLALPPVARACFFNSAALGLGFSVLLVSDLPTLMRFGGLVAVAAFASYAAALLIVPALFAAGHAWFGPGFRRRQRIGVPASLLVLACAAAILLSDDVLASAGEADRIAANVAAREESRAARRLISMTLTDRRNRSEEREAIVHKVSGDNVRKTRVTFVAPKRSRDFTFLSHDHAGDGKTDERWMFIPAERKVRRIAASQRGNSFFGTDFSYDDIQSELKFRLDEWDFEYRGRDTVDGRERFRISGRPKHPRIARELGYGAFDAVVDGTAWMPVEIEFFDLRERPLKTIEVRVFEPVDDIWTARDIVATNHRSGHRTRLEVREVEYPPSLPARLFDSQALARGLPR